MTTRAGVVAASVLAHLAAFQLILWAQPTDPPMVEPPSVTVAMVTLPPPRPPVVPPPLVLPPIPEPKPAPPAKGGAKSETPRPQIPAPRARVRPTPAPTEKPVLAAAPKPAPDTFVELGVDEARSAAGAGSGSGSGSGSGPGGDGGRCDMVRRLQNALSRDGRVKSAVGGATGVRGSTGRGMVVWNGDWVTSEGQDGKGLAAVRQAIMWEVGFAPKACREQAVRGYVVVVLEDRTRIALGSGAWRWSDLLGLRRP